ncbi:hypothetical protein [Maribacter sp. ACAM166]|uniref:hypothetical protein n=1 Tax=Maribacter sp. ACAM166 TaxID=2508996 RepID=UPI0020181F7A|nr:hypothetical protein [Maribacter sp. ACAM166]
MVDAYINTTWLKLSPAFNTSMCTMFTIAPLDFYGENDSVFQEYNKKGNLFMEYLEDYGCFEDVPIEFMVKMNENITLLFLMPFQTKRSSNYRF